MSGARAPLGPAPRPVTPTDPVELRLAGSAIRLIAALAVPVVAVAFALAGRPGALGAVLGAAIVGGVFLLSAALLSSAARLGPTALLAAALGGYLLRLLLYAVLIVVLRPVEAFSHESLALSTAFLLIAALVWEVRLVSRTPGLFWLEAGAETGLRRSSVVESRHPERAGGPGARGEDDAERTPV
jgi:hypothetical protein